MKGSKILILFLGALLLAAFNITFFLLVAFPAPASVWISYGFIHAATLLPLASFFAIKGTEDKAVYKLILSAFSAIYFIAELIIGTIFIIAAPDGWKLLLILQIIGLFVFFALAAVVLFASQPHAKGELQKFTNTDKSAKKSYEKMFPGAKKK